MMSKKLLIVIAVVMITVIIMFGTVIVLRSNGATNGWADYLEAVHPGSNFDLLRYNGPQQIEDPGLDPLEEETLLVPSPYHTASSPSDKSNESEKSEDSEDSRELPKSHDEFDEELTEVEVLAYNTEAENRLKVNLEDDALRQNQYWLNSSDLLAEYSMSAYDKVRLESGFSDAVSLPLDVGSRSDSDLQKAVNEFLTDEVMRNPVTLDTFGRMAEDLRVGSQSVWELNGFLSDFVAENDDHMPFKEDGKWFSRYSEGDRGWEYLIYRYSSETEGTKHLSEEYRRTAAMACVLFDQMVICGITTDAPSRHYALNYTAYDEYRRTVELTSSETQEWLILAYYRKDGRTEFRIGINLKDRRLGVFEKEPDYVEELPEPIPANPEKPAVTPPSTPTPKSTPTPSTKPTPTPTPSPSATPTPTPSTKPTPTPTPSPSATPTPTPSPSPTKDPSQIVTPSTDPQGAGQADLAKPETRPYSSTEPTPAPQPTPKATPTPVPTATINTDKDDCYTEDSEVRDDTRPAPTAAPSTERGSVTSTKEQEIVSQSTVTSTFDESTIPFDD